MPRFHRELAGLATDWVRSKRRTLQQGTPQTVTDSGGTVNQYSWQGQDLDRAELRKARDMRQSGGVVAFLFESKATMRFGTGAELQSENEDLEAWLNDQFAPVDLLTLDLGADATWYPYGLGEIVETRGGEFSHIEPIEPWTMLPQTDDHGDIVVWEQQTQGDRSRDPTPFDPDEIGSITLNKAAARDRVGVSEVLRSEEEITQYKQNQRAVDKAIEVAGFPHHVWTVGSEGRSPVDDTDLKRVRNLIDDMDGDTQFVVGPDVDHDKITAADFDFENVTKRDLRKLTTAVGLPMEIAGYGREGLGSGSEAALVTDMLALQNEVARRRFEAQFITEFVEPVVRRYSPFDPDAEDIGLHIPAFLDDTDELADLINKVGEYMSTAEVRERLDLPPLEDDDKREAFRSPQQVEEAEEDDPAAQQPAGGLFGSERDLSDADLALVDDDTPDFDRHYLALLEGHAWNPDAERTLIASSEVPEMVQQRLRDAILGGALFSEFDDIPSSRLTDLRMEFVDMLDADGWTTDELTDQLQEFEPSLSDAEAEAIARTETASVVNTAREEAYKDRGLGDAQFKWVGTSDHRTTEACTWLKEQTNPDFGGSPVTLAELKELIAEAPEHDDDMDDNLARPENTIVHPNERHTYTRHVE